MTRVTATAQRRLTITAAHATAALADPHQYGRTVARPFYNVRIDDTALSYDITFAGGVRTLDMRITEPAAGTIVHTDVNGSGLEITYTVSPIGDGALVKVVASFIGEEGVAGFVERIVAPRRLRRVFRRQLACLNTGQEAAAVF